MKITVACVVVALVPLVATFAPGSTHRRNIAQLFAVSDDVPDIVKAYKKVKAEPTFPELPKIPETPTPEPVVTYVEPVQVPVPAPLPEIKIELPTEASQPVIEIQSAVSDSIESMKQSIPSVNLQQTADQVNAQFKGLNDFMKATQEQLAIRAAEKGSNTVPTLGEMIQSGFATKRATFTETTMVPQGKAPTLVEYVLGGFKSPTGGISSDNLAESQEKMSLLVKNTISLFGNSAPDSVDLNLPGNMSPETAAGLAVAGVAVLVMAGQNNKNPPTPVKPISLDAAEEEAPLSELAKDVKKMAEQIQRLSDETKSLRSELKQAQDRITQKELDISKERLRSADAELTLKREIQKVTLKLRESEAKNKALEKELAATEEMRTTLTMSLEKIQALEKQLTTSSKDDIVAPAPAPVKKEKAPSPTPAKAKVAEPQPAPAPKPAPKTSAKKAASPAKEEPAAPAPVVTEAPMSTTTSKAAAPAKKTTSRKKTGIESKETPITIEVIPTKSKKASTSDTKKSKETTKKVEPVPDSDDWSSLSESTLSRKTVKELMEYLSDKGVDTNDNDGKPLKKALLLEAVRSL